MHREVPVKITHVTLHWPSKELDLPLTFPARGLHSKTAADMLAVLREHIASACGSIDGVASKVRLLTVVVVSDAAKSNRTMLHITDLTINLSLQIIANHCRSPGTGIDELLSHRLLLSGQ